MKMIKSYGIPQVKQGFVKEVNEAKKIAKKIGFPVVIKVDSPEMTHKTDFGGVVKGIKDEADLEVKYDKMIKDVKKRFPKAKIPNVAVQKMVTEAVETIIGTKKDPQFGNVLVFGTGGIYVETEQDVSFRVVPVNQKDVDQMMRETRIYKVLSGFRGRKYDIKSVQDCLLKISRMIQKNPRIEEMDINPLFVTQKGSVAVDARIVTSG